MRWSAWLGAFCLLLAGCGGSGPGGGGSTGSSESAKTVQPLAHPLEATCGQVGFGKAKFPNAKEKWNFQTAGALAEEYRDTGSPAQVLKTSFSVALLGICNKTRDPSYQPVPQIRALAADAQKMVDDDPTTDFGAALVLVASGEARGKEEVNADAAFITAANRLCREQGRQIRPLVRKAIEPGSGAFKLRDANRLSPRLRTLTTKLNSLASKSDAKNARGFASGYAALVRTFDRLATRLAKLNEDYYNNLDAAIPLASKLEDKAIDLSVSPGDVKACGDIFSFA